MDRTGWIDRWKGLLICLVVMGHVAGGAYHIVKDDVQGVLSLIFKVIYMFHMPAFFMLAGITWKDKEESIISFIRKKSLRLLVPYIIFGVISICIFIILDIVVAQSINNYSTTDYYSNKIQTHIWWQLLIGLVHGGGWPNGEGFRMNSVLWFLPAMFTTLLVFRMIRSKGNIVTCVICGLIYAVSFIKNLPPYLPWGISVLPKYLFFVMTGWILAPIFCRINVACSEHKYKALFICIIMMIGYIWLVSKCPDPAIVSKSIIWTIVFLGLTITGCFISAVLVMILDCKVCERLGMATMGIMLIHKFPVVFLELKVPIIRAIFNYGGVFTLLWTMLLTVIIVLSCYSVVWCVNRTQPWILGERRKCYSK